MLHAVGKICFGAGCTLVFYWGSILATGARSAATGTTNMRREGEEEEEEEAGGGCPYSFVAARQTRPALSFIDDYDFTGDLNTSLKAG